jgi:hypothetical protein
MSAGQCLSLLQHQQIKMEQMLNTAATSIFRQNYNMQLYKGKLFRCNKRGRRGVFAPRAHLSPVNSNIIKKLKIISLQLKRN